MRRTTLVTSGVAAAAALSLVAVPAIAQGGVPWAGTSPAAASSTPDPDASASGDPTCPMADDATRAGGSLGAGPGYGMRGGMRGQGAAGTASGGGYGMRGGSGSGYGYGVGGGMGVAASGVTAPSGELTAEQRTTLSSMAEEEKLAHDLYVALAARYPELRQFPMIAVAETRHLELVRTVLERYGIDDPTSGLAEGTFASAQFQSTYDRLLAGATTSEAALAAGVTVEKADIGDLQSATAGLTAPDVLQVYAALLAGSQHHLAAFGG